MRTINPKTKEYRQCLISLIGFGFIEPLRKIRSFPDQPIQIINEGESLGIKNHPLNFVKYNSDKGFVLFPMP
ncbi:MAG TPA: hypothetical protein DCS36_08730 [Sphingobacterium sp.]|nr:hypothetical protein [Sphingobacterium sp.]